MTIGVWPWIVLGLGLFLGFVALVVAIIVIIKTKKFLVPILIYIPFLLVSLALIGIFAYQVVVSYDTTDDDWYYNYNTNSDYDYNTNDDYSYENYYDGIITNQDYAFKIYVGEDEELNFFETKEYYPLEGVTDAYYYCYLTTDYDWEDYYCGTGWSNAFSIYVYSEAQYLENEDLITGTLMGYDGGYYFVFYHPNGLLPDDVPTTQTFYDSVIYSIDFAD